MATPAQRNTDELPIIALVGRVNVGKSTLFNRLVEADHALVSANPGTTRNNNEGAVRWRGTYARLIDTGGLPTAIPVALEAEIGDQRLRALKETDVIVFVTDGRVGVNGAERAFAKFLHETYKDKKVFLVANKVDTNTVDTDLDRGSWQALGFGLPHVISATNGRNIGDVLDLIFDELRRGKRRPKIAAHDEAPLSFRVSIIGRPNVGKSSLFNKIIGEDRVIVSPMPHTTREPYDTLIRYEYEIGKKKTNALITFVDTAGIRRKAQVTGELEKAGIDKSIQSIEDSDIVLFVIDGTEPISSQDRQLGGLLEKRGKSVIILVNKWDLATESGDEHRNNVMKMVYSYFPHLDFAPILFVSGKTGYRTHNIFPFLLRVFAARHTQVPEVALASFLKLAKRQKYPTKGRGSRLPDILSMRQMDVAPPVFELMIKYRTSVNESYINYLENRLREQFEFTGTPIVMYISKMKR